MGLLERKTTSQGFFNPSWEQGHSVDSVGGGGGGGGGGGVVFGGGTS